MTRLALSMAVVACLAFVACGDTSSSGPNVVTESIIYTHEGVELEGYLAYDADLSRRRPGVLVVHEWWGLQDHPKESARKLAALGYVAFCLDMYGKGKVSDAVRDAKEWSGAFYGDPSGFGRARAKAGLDVLAAHKLVDPEKIAAIGYCYGGSVALELAYANAGLKGAVCFHGRLLVPTEPESTSIETPILVCNGAADIWVPAEMIKTWQDAMVARGATFDFQSYPDAVHTFTNPGADARGMDNVAYNKAADERSWDHMRTFLKENLGR